MGILNVKADQVGLVGVTPKFIYINTNDPVADVTAVGYLNSLAKTFGVNLSVADMALVTTVEAPGDPVTSGLYNIVKAGDNFSLVVYPAAP
jgi:hypothetical protein